MSKIKVLSNQIINQIAAGEIIERPFAVVRELVDNSLDAASENIKVILEGGGIQRIEVVDDGRGISEDEIELAITRHATSKIEKETDLESIASLGFRGEALASIASVSQFSIESSDNENNTACKISLFGGSKKDLIVTNRKQGTSVTVKNIFFNVPARKKFLKKSTTEQLKITNWLKQISLTRPDVSFSLISDSKEILRFPKADSIKERAKKVFKDSNFAFLERLSGDYKLSVYLSPPIDAKQKSTTTNILVNKRVVNDSTLLRAIKEAYGNTLKPREYPQGFIHLEVPPHEIDVNVHPQKSEVKRLESKGIEVTFKNQEKKLIEIKKLRDSCPCAECRELRGEGNHSEPIKISNKKKKIFNIVEHSAEEALKITKVWPVGNYALGVLWGDNHDSGIYTYDYIYKLANC
jgi:DNA mismatch repair protein MutL